MIPRFSQLFLWLAALTLPASLSAQCNTAPLVAADQAEAFLVPIWIDVLANDVDPEGEAMTPSLVGGSCGTVGSVSVLLDLVNFQPPSTGLASPCTILYRVTDESGNMSASATVTVNNQTDPIFVDGFESGDTSAWSETCNSTCGVVPE